MPARSQWIQEHRRDQFYRLAKRKGYRSRAAFKLLQAARKYNFLKPGDSVVDLGSAPGGWLQAARQVVGDDGYVLGVDIQSIEPLHYDNLETVVADLEDAGTSGLVAEKLGGLADVILCDISPNLSGAWEVDNARQIHVARRALELCGVVLKPGGNFFVKVFHGPDLEEFKTEVRARFATFRVVKPPASRAKSSELFLLGMGFRP